MSRRISGPIRLLAALAMTLALIAGVTGVAPRPAVAADQMGGNPTCADLGAQYFELKVDPPVSGSYSDGTLSVDVAVSGDGKTLDWSSNIGVDAVIVKGGDGAYVYWYDEGTGDSGLQAPLNGGGNVPALSHFNFCYDLSVEVSKSASTTYTRTFSWNVEKSVDQASVDLYTGDSATVNYTVSVTQTGSTDSDWAASGSIFVTNPSATESATITSVTDTLDGVGGVPVSCPVGLPYDLPGGATLECSYSVALPDASSRVNYASVTTSGKIAGGDGAADVLFGDPTTVIDGSVSLVDSMVGDLGAFTGSDAVTYSTTFTCDGDAGEHDNTATISGSDSGELDSSSASVVVSCTPLPTPTPVPALNWCSPGFWATRQGTLAGTAYDPAPYLNTPVPGYTQYTVGYALANPKKVKGGAFNAAADYLSAMLLPNAGTSASGEHCPIDAFGKWVG